jgi:hypothetical protein
MLISGKTTAMGFSHAMNFGDLFSNKAQGTHAYSAIWFHAYATRWQNHQNAKNDDRQLKNFDDTEEIHTRSSFEFDRPHSSHSRVFNFNFHMK